MVFNNYLKSMGFRVSWMGVSLNFYSERTIQVNGMEWTALAFVPESRKPIAKNIEFNYK